MSQTKITDAVRTVTAVDGTKIDAVDGAKITTGTIPEARITALAATKLTGTVADARFPATLPAASGANLTALSATNLGSGTIPDARFPATLPAVSGANLTGVGVTGVTATGSGITVTGSVLETVPLSGTIIQTQCTTNTTMSSIINTTSNIVTQAFTKRLSSSVSRLEFTGWTSFGLYTHSMTNQDGTDPRLYVTTTGGGQVGDKFYFSDVPFWAGTHTYNGEHDVHYKSGTFNVTTVGVGSYTYYLTVHGGTNGVYVNRPNGAATLGGISGLKISEVVI